MEEFKILTIFNNFWLCIYLLILADNFALCIILRILHSLLLFWHSVPYPAQQCVRLILRAERSFWGLNLTTPITPPQSPKYVSF